MGEPTTIDAEIETASNGDDITVLPKASPKKRPAVEEGSPRNYLAYVMLPAIFLLVTLLGGMRFPAGDSAFVFLKPDLVALVLAALTLLMFVRSGTVSLEGWLGKGSPPLTTAAGAAVLVTLFTATTQLYNSLLPEQGITFWVVGFCFFWTVWNNLFAELDARRSIRSTFALFGLAFVVKYLILMSLTAAPTESWWQRLIQDPGKEAFTWLLDLPRYSPATGYVQFFALALYLIGLYLLPSSPLRRS